MFDTSREGIPLKKNAFTMLEFVFVIVVAGILAAALIPRMDRDTLYEASEQLLRDIRYTQHMAMMDNVYRDNVQNWFYERWKIDFTTADKYTISKGSTTSFTTHNVTAEDPATSRPINGTEDYDYAANFNITFPASGLLYFDNLGRPYQIASGNPASATSNLLKNDYSIVLTDSKGKTATITVRPETGYTDITYN